MLEYELENNLSFISLNFSTAITTVLKSDIISVQIMNLNNTASLLYFNTRKTLTISNCYVTVPFKSQVSCINSPLLYKICLRIKKNICISHLKCVLLCIKRLLINYLEVLSQTSYRFIKKLGKLFFLRFKINYQIKTHVYQMNTTVVSIFVQQPRLKKKIKIWVYTKIRSFFF